MQKRWQNMVVPPLNSRRVLMIGFGILVLILVLFSGKMVENVDNSEIVIIQSVFTGRISIYTTPGPVFQGFGTATHYKNQISFGSAVKKTKEKILSMKINLSKSVLTMVVTGR